MRRDSNGNTENAGGGKRRFVVVQNEDDSEFDDRLLELLDQRIPLITSILLALVFVACVAVTIWLDASSDIIFTRS